MWNLITKWGLETLFPSLNSRLDYGSHNPKSKTKDQTQLQSIHGSDVLYTDANVDTWQNIKFRIILDLTEGIDLAPKLLQC
jgi:hypothetical protein